MDIDAFTSQFAFSHENAFKISVERECFLVDAEGAIVPKAREALSMLQLDGDSSQFDKELSACQIESRVSLLSPHDVGMQLARTEATLRSSLKVLGLSPSYTSVGPENMPLSVYPLPRYEKIAASHAPHDLLSACRVIGTHVHIGMPNRETAIRVHNNMRAHMRELCEMGNKSNGERLAIYKSFAADWEAPDFESWGSFYRYALEHGFAHDPRSWWSLMRISRHGTYEGRMFDATDNVGEVNNWALTFWRLCLLASK